MKKRRFLFPFLALLLFAADSLAQSALFAKRTDLADFDGKTVKVVIDNHSFFNLSLENAMKENWKLCPVEFCSQEQFEELKCDTSYYFMIRTAGVFKKENEPSMEFLSLLKGGPEAEEGIDAMYDILTLPLNSIDDDGSSIIPYLGAYVNIIQTHISRLQKRKLASFMGISWYSNRLSEINGMKLLVNENDLSALLTGGQAEEILCGAGEVADEDAVCDALERAAARTLVSLCVAPKPGQRGSYCYKMLISTDANELFYYRKQKVTGKAPKGFLKAELEKIAVYLK